MVASSMDGSEFCLMEVPVLKLVETLVKLVLRMFTYFLRAEQPLDHRLALEKFHGSPLKRKGPKSARL